MWITPNHDHTHFTWPLNIDSKITIFHEQTKGWQLDIAEQTINAIGHSGFAVLSIAFSYLEMIGKYQEGYANVGQSRKYFKKGFYSVFPELSQQPQNIAEDFLNSLYEGCRCGLYHRGLTNARILLTGTTQVPITFETGGQGMITINPAIMIANLQRHLQYYVTELRNPLNTRLIQKFERRFDYDAAQR
jgi:hypothetical protein